MAFIHLLMYNIHVVDVIWILFLGRDIIIYGVSSMLLCSKCSFCKASSLLL